MTLKTSSFKINKTILKKTFLRFWPIWALYLVIMIFTMPATLYADTRNINTISVPISISDITGYIASEKLANLLNVLDYNLTPILVAPFAILAAVSAFSYLYASRSCNMMHAFPVKRSELFITHYVAGFLFLLIPQVIIFLVTAITCGVLGISGIQYLALWLVFVVGLSFFFYSMAVFCCMLTGNYFAGFAFFVLFNLFYVAFSALLITLAEKICYGFSASFSIINIPGIFLSPLIYLMSNDRIAFDYTLQDYIISNIEISGGNIIALYCIPAIALIGLAMFLYSRRNVECASEIAAHRFVRPMTRWLVTIVGALGLDIWFTFVFFDNSRFFFPVLILMLIVCSWVVFFLLEMIIKKKFKIFTKGRFLEWAVCLGVMLLTLGLMETDAFGVEKRVPTADDTEGVIVYAGHDMVITDADQIAQIIQAHQEIIDSKDEYEILQNDYYVAPFDEENSEVLSSQYVSIEYVLKNGKSFERSYNIPITKEYLADHTRAAALIRDLQDETDSALRSWLVYNYEDLDIIGGVLYKYGTYSETSVYEDSEVIIDKEQMEILYQAMMKDILEGNTLALLGANPGKDLETGYSYLNCHISFSGEMDEQPITIYDISDALREKIDVQINGFASGVSTESASYYYEMTNTGKYIVDGYFDILSSCEHTINAMLELDLIESIQEITNDDVFLYD